MFESTANAAAVAASAAKKTKINELTLGLMAALDRTKTMSRNATYLLCETASSLGHNVDSLNISRNSVQRARSKFRTSSSANLRSDFTAGVPLTVHWDGKLMEDLSTHEHVDCLPVIVSGVGIEQLLGVPKLATGTGEARATAVVQCLEEWGY